MTDPPAGISFMGKDWDSDKGGGKEWTNWLSQVMRECYRVMKPGAHGLVWALPRISHRTAMAIEWSGLEVRDVVTHLFGSGFPKSLDISKAIDKKLGKSADRKIIGYKQQGTKSMFDGGKPRPASLPASLWNGFGTALKPAAEFWFLVRKPIDGSVAENVLRHGTGGLNIDASRIGGETRFNPPTRKAATAATAAMGSFAMCDGEGSTVSGRFPANLVLSHDPECVEIAPGKRLEGKRLEGKRTTNHYGGKTQTRPNSIKYPDEKPAQFKCTESCAVKKLDSQSGQFAGLQLDRQTGRFAFHAGIGGRSGMGIEGGKKDFGGASRFFYCAKPSRHERDFGVEGVERYINNVGRNSQKILEANNNHPTVKPYKLMRYFIRLVTPPGGTVLDCFMGSGTTGAVAVACGFKFVGIEQDENFLRIARSRIESVKLSGSVADKKIE